VPIFEICVFLSPSLFQASELLIDSNYLRELGYNAFFLNLSKITKHVSFFGIKELHLHAIQLEIAK